MTTISAFLSERLSEIEDEALVAVAVIASVSPGAARRARSGEGISASDALRLFAARGYDPMTRKAIAPRRLGEFNHEVLRLFIRTQMQVRCHSVRVAAAEMNASPSSVENMRRGRHVSLGNVIKACTYLDIHPFDQCERLKQEQKAEAA